MGARLTAASLVSFMVALGASSGVEQPAREARTAWVMPPAPDGVTIEKDVAYLAPGRAEKLDLYLPAARATGVRSPAVVIIHGGGWTNGDKGASREFNIGTTLAKAGYVAASVNYQIEGAERWPTNLLDCKNAVRFLRAGAERHGVDVDRIGVIGGSAGGHLALLVGYTHTLGSYQTLYSSYSQTDRFTIAPTWQISGKTLLSLRYAWAQIDYLGAPFAAFASPQRRDTTHDTTLSFNWEPYHKLTLIASLQNSSRGSNFGGQDYASNMATLSASYTY